MGFPQFGWLVGFSLVVCESPEEEGNEGLAGLICQRWRLVSRRGALGRVKWLLGRVFPGNDAD